MKMKWKLQHWHAIAGLLIIYDIITVNLGYMLVLLLRFDGRYSSIPGTYLDNFVHIMPVYTVVVILIYLFLRLYRSVWRYASYSEIFRVFFASALSLIALILISNLMQARMPLSFYLIGIIVQAFCTIAIRFSYRFYIFINNQKVIKNEKEVKHVMVIGAGEAGQIIIREIGNSTTQKETVECIIDDNANKWGRYINGILIFGGRDDILKAVDKYDIDKIYCCIPSASAEERREVLNICNNTKCEVSVLPSVYQMANNGDIKISAMKPVSVEDLLGRPPIQVNMEEIYKYIEGKTILVTGGGGSIGSELCRQIAGHHPKRLIIFDVYENNAYAIQQELKKKYQNLNLVVLIGSVRDSRRIEQVFEKYCPEVVYHAAAHKHVPLMEDSPCEAIKNNVIGTYKTARAALKYGTERFVLISTDKAVNPTNVMGASKRICEMIIQTMNYASQNNRINLLPYLAEHILAREYISDIPAQRQIKTEYVAVRFGNVLGSNGSVVPLFKKQIEEGGPVTVTHPDIIRYFMTIPEAVSLVLQAGTYAKGGEIFVLDMGAPVKIDTLARNLIKLSGFEPDVDIKIQYTGLRPGEKLYEEKLMKEEGMRKTENDLIHIGKPIEFDMEAFVKNLKVLMKLANENQEDEMILKLSSIVTTYKASSSILNKKTYETLLKTSK